MTGSLQEHLHNVNKQSCKPRALDAWRRERTTFRVLSSVRISRDIVLAREGTGLGLALVKALVAEHGGSFDVTNRENVGTEITVMLPRRQQPRASPAA